MLMLSQPEFAEVRRSSFLLHASWKVHLAVVEPDGLLCCTKGCLDRWSEHALPKLKSNNSSSNYSMGESEHLCARTLFMLFGGFIKGWWHCHCSADYAL